jgi:integrase
MSHNYNHPKRGASIKVEPIRDLDAIKAIKRHLADEPRNLCLFTLGINTGYRAGELLSISVGQIAPLKAGDRLEVKQPKNNKYRAVTLNNNSYLAVQNWLFHHPDLTDKALLFLSHNRHNALSVGAVNNLVKQWCRDADLKGNYGSHSLRKTWGYHQRIQSGVSVALLMEAFGHSCEAQTLAYLCIQKSEVQDLYSGLEL